MEGPDKIARFFIILGASLIVFGIIFSGVFKNGFNFKLPGDIYYKKDGFSFYFPITTSIIISLIASLIINLFKK